MISAEEEGEEAERTRSAEGRTVEVKEIGEEVSVTVIMTILPQKGGNIPAYQQGLNRDDRDFLWRSFMLSEIPNLQTRHKIVSC